MKISESYDIVTKVKECIYQYNILLGLNSEFSDEDQLKMCNSIFYMAGSIKKVCEYAVDTNSILICKRIIRYLHPEIEDLLKSWMGNKGKFMDAEKQLTFFANISAIKANIRMVRKYLESVQPEEKNNSKNVNEIPKKEDESPEEETTYTPELLNLFHNKRELIDELPERLGIGFLPGPRVLTSDEVDVFLRTHLLQKEPGSRHTVVCDYADEIAVVLEFLEKLLYPGKFLRIDLLFYHGAHLLDLIKDLVLHFERIEPCAQ